MCLSSAKLLSSSSFFIIMYIIKHKPEDFVVIERTAIELSGSGKYLYVKLVKRNRNTLEVVQHLAGALQIREKDIGFAGSKDKKALTEQYISVAGVSKERMGRVKIPDVELQVVGSGKVPISLGDLEGNSFVITVRNLEQEEVNKEVLKKITFIPNYFDEQRFGSNNAEIGKCLIQKNFAEAAGLISNRTVGWHLEKFPQDFVGALKKIPLRLLRLYVNAYQSWLWNEMVAAILLQSCNVRGTVAYSRGKLVFPEKALDVSFPVVGFNGAELFTDEKLRLLAEKKMGSEGIGYADFVIKQIPELTLAGELRWACGPVQGMKVGALEDDDCDDCFPRKKKVQVSFTLGKGSYGTMVIRRMLG